jgi:hypothetical protein
MMVRIRNFSPLPWAAAAAALMLLAAPAFAVSTYLGIQPGLSTRANVESILGAPVSSQAPNILEFRASGGGRIVVEFREKDGLVDKLERFFPKPVSRAAMLRSLGLPAEPEERRNLKEGNLVEYFGDIKTLALTYRTGEERSGIISVGYYSMELYERMLDKARNPTVQFDPSQCRDLFLWASAEREPAKKAKNPGRLQMILEIAILSQRGECEKARALEQVYRQQFR